MNTQDDYEHFLSYSNLQGREDLRRAYFHGANAPYAEAPERMTGEQFAEMQRVDPHSNSALVTEKELQERTAAPRVHQSDVDAAVLRSEYTLLPDGRTTICLITMRNGFTVRGESSCVFVENYRKDIGERVAREDAYGKVWAFLGFALAEKRHVEANIAPHTIGWAIKNMWLGGRMTREGWNGKGQYIAIQRPDANSMNTLPYVYIVTVQGQRVPWLASQTDLLATDWQTAF